MKASACEPTPPTRFFELNTKDGGVGSTIKQVDSVPNKSMAYVLVVSSTMSGKRRKYEGRLAKVEGNSLAPMEVFHGWSEQELTEQAMAYFRTRFSVDQNN